MGSEQSTLGNIKSNQVNFTINGVDHSIRTDEGSSDINPSTKLVDYIRDKAGLKGTKLKCREGGCGACVVSVKSGGKVRGVNSCLTSVFSCDGWAIETVEALGSHKAGYHPIQNRLVAAGGSQCGFCTPGMVMNMYALQAGNKDLTMRDIEDAFDGNICRCTGYRPILDAFKSFGKDATPELVKLGLEDKKETKCFNCACAAQCGVIELPEAPENDPEIEMLHLKVSSSGEEWFRPNSLVSLFEIIQRLNTAQQPFRFVAGNTGMGVYPDLAKSKNYIDLSSVPALKAKEITKDKFSLGGGITLASAIKALGRASAFDEYKSYAGRVQSHIKRIANTPVRNSATLAGNLMIKYRHHEFPSDIFTILEGLGAQIVIASSPTINEELPPTRFLECDMTDRVILGINFPQLRAADGWIFKSFKITRRFQNAHAYVNAALLFKVDKAHDFKVLETPRIVYGGIEPKFAHAHQIEDYLSGKSLKDEVHITVATDLLEKVLMPNEDMLDGSPEYRKILAMGLLYKVILSIVDTQTSPKVRSGSFEIIRKLTSGKRDFDMDKTDWPIYQPVHKLESKVQASGEAEYVNDISHQNRELFGVLIQTTVANAELDTVDASEALQVPGIVAFVSAKDIPGVNNYQKMYSDSEEVFVSSKVRFAGASIGMLMGINREITLDAASKVNVTYKNVQKPVLDIATKLTRSEMEPNIQGSLSDAPHRAKCQFNIGKQSHFSMEDQITLVVPKENGNYDVFTSSQWISHAQDAIAEVLNIPHHSINISVKRLGGGFGGKLTRSSQVAAAAAIGAHKTGRPVRLALSMRDTMNLIGTRPSHVLSYDVGFDNSGKILDNFIKILCDAGCNANEQNGEDAVFFIQNAYNCAGWKVEHSGVLTNTHPSTWVRAPGTPEAVFITESIMEHIAKTLKKDIDEIRMVNYIKEGDPSTFLTPDVKFTGENPLLKMIEELKKSSDYEKRRSDIAQFNEANRWKKRGIALTPIRYPIHYFHFNHPTFVAIYRGDGTVAVSCGGIEMGQGLNTKLVQVVASKLGIPIEKVKVKPSSNFTSANCQQTGGSMTSELVAGSAFRACEILNERIEPIRKRLGSNVAWEKLIEECYKEDVQLTAVYHFSKHDGPKDYDSFAASITEVAIDVLTGEYKIARVDIIEDTGKSINPEIDIGQIEGALVMGIGYWTTEKMIFDPESGELLTNNTWKYKPPLPKDIPEDIRVTLLKNAPNPFGVLRSKATGEPPLAMSVGVLFAMRHAIDAARKDAGLPDEFFTMNTPMTPEDILRLCKTSKTQFTL